ncbi:asparagine synthetase B family protein [Spirosoma radiotolerans]|uniref:asparagine synthase (glutamine-hydrolyzing) n=1 Tax=Spirosoma radiotolerans TaxID=1379870 RepID=A0A0E3ZSU1_9BACT|nr:asparagine synthase-related protein [Spirosoma radiotolerans]AKD54564.1 asparagine synthase [Spirosoma radiotolerans]
MSGIAGVVRLDGQDVLEVDTAAMINSLAHRGEVVRQAIDQGILLAFGGALETDPATETRVAADADLFTDAEQDNLFASMFAQGGPAAFNDINADFAIALWEASRQTLVCARDPLGVKPLYYVYQPGRFFAFASEIKALLALQEVVVKPNEHKFREYLTWTTSYVPYSAETFYESIYSLLPGHSIQVNAQGLALQPYWQINPTAYRSLTRPEDYSALFYDTFTAAIERRMKGKKRVGAHLSGGLDSSSVSSVAQFLLEKQQRPSLHTFNIDTGLASTDESEYVRAFVSKWHPQHHTVQPKANVLESVLAINHLFDRPDHFIIPSSFHLGVSQEANQFGCDILLTGHDGDSVITTGFDFLDQLLDASDWERLQAACHQYIDHRYPPDFVANPPRLRNDDEFERYALSILGTNLKKRFREQSSAEFLAQVRHQKQIFGLSTVGILSYAARRVKAKLTHRTLLDSAFSESFNQRVVRRPLVSTEPLTTELSQGRPVSANQVLNTTNVICAEQLNHIGAHYGHAYSFPFFDKHVVELGLATPLEVCFDQGRGRGLIRNGLSAVLPTAIVNRYTKANFVEYGNVSAQQLYQATHEQFALAGHPIWGVIDRAAFAKIVRVVFNARIPVKQKTRYNWLLSRIIYLALWLGAIPKKG